MAINGHFLVGQRSTWPERAVKSTVTEKKKLHEDVLSVSFMKTGRSGSINGIGISEGRH